MPGRLVLLVIALLSAGSAQAQTGGINPIPLIIQFESSGNPTTFIKLSYRPVPGSDRHVGAGAV